MPIPYIETMKRGSCSNPYGWTKVMMEEILEDAAKADPELSVVLLRYFNPIGAHESGRIGEDPQGYSEQSDAVYRAGCRWPTRSSHDFR